MTAHCSRSCPEAWSPEGHPLPLVLEHETTCSICQAIIKQRRTEVEEWTKVLAGKVA